MNIENHVRIDKTIRSLLFKASKTFYLGCFTDEEQSSALANVPTDLATIKNLSISSSLNRFMHPRFICAVKNNFHRIYTRLTILGPIIYYIYIKILRSINSYLTMIFIIEIAISIAPTSLSILAFSIFLHRRNP